MSGVFHDDLSQDSLSVILVIRHAITAGRFRIPLPLNAFFFILVLPGTLAAQTKEYDITRYTTHDGLSDNNITSIFQDGKGFMWFGTVDGLNRFDGYTFRVFHHHSKDSTSLSSDDITAITEDRRGTLWIGTEHGLNRYDRTTNRFIRYRTQDKNNNGLGNDQIVSLAVDSTNNLWIGTTDGLYFLKQGAKQFREVIYTRNASIAQKEITYILPDSSGMVYIGTKAGFYTLVPSSGGYELYDNHIVGWILSIVPLENGTLMIGKMYGWPRIFHPKDHKIQWPKDTIISLKALCTDTDGAALFCAVGGVYRLDSMTVLDESNVICHTRKLTHEFSRKMFKDRDGNFWVGTLEGILLLTVRTVSFTTHLVSDPVAAPDVLTDILSLHVTSGGALCISSEYGLIYYDSLGTMRLDHCLKCPIGITHHIYHGHIKAYLEEPDGSLLLSARGMGIVRFDPRTARMTNCRMTESGNVRTDWIISFARENKDYFWAGTRGGGLLLLNTKFQIVRRFFSKLADPKSISSSVVYCVLRDSKGVLWIGTNNGLNRWNPSDSSFIRYRFNPASPNSICGNSVVSLLEDHNGDLWIGSYGAGLSKYDRAQDTFTRFTRENGLPAQSISNLIEDNDGMIWISSAAGLMRYDPRRNCIHTYSIEDGLKSDAIYDGVKGRKNELIFGSSKGYFRFYPDQIRENPHIPKVVITSIKVFDREIRAELNDGDTLDIAHADNMLTIQFAALNYNKPRRNQYAFLLGESSDKWIDLGTNREVVLAGLDPGYYLLRIRGSNNDGLWNQAGIAIAIHVLPPYYMTWWFRTLLCVSVFALILLLYHRRNTYVRELGKSESRYRMITELMSDYAYLYKVRADTTLDLVWMTDSFTRLTGYSAEDADEDDFIRRIVHPDDLEQALRDHQRLLEGEPLQTEHRIVTKAGETRSVDRRSSPVLNKESKRVEYIYGVVSDITARKESERRVVESELTALRAQMNPHFFFNSLNAIQSFIITNEKKLAADYLSKFARLMRLILENSKHAFVEIREEIQLLDLYIELEAIRFDNRFTSRIEIDPDMDCDARIPSMLIQPYVENAIRHGLVHRGAGGMLRVTLHRTDHKLLCSIEDNGIGRGKAGEIRTRQGESRRSMGMMITKERLDILNADLAVETNVTITDLFDEDGMAAGTRVDISIPVEDT